MAAVALVGDLAENSPGGADATFGVLLELDACLYDIKWVHDERGDYSSCEAGRRLDQRGCEGDRGLPAFDRRIHPRHHCGGGGGRNCCGGVVGCSVFIVSGRKA